MSDEAKTYKGWVTVAMVADEIDANLKKGFLETAGINCVIEPSIYRAEGYLLPLFNQFKINVPQEDAETAKQVLLEVK